MHLRNNCQFHIRKIRANGKNKLRTKDIYIQKKRCARVYLYVCMDGRDGMGWDGMHVCKYEYIYIQTWKYNHICNFKHLYFYMLKSCKYIYIVKHVYCESDVINTYITNIKSSTRTNMYTL